MTFYYVLLAFHLMIVSFLAYFLFRAIRRFRKVGGKLSMRLYFAPILLSGLTLFYLIFFAGPYLLDLISISNGTFEVLPVSIARVSGPLVFTENGGIMFYNPLAQALEAGNHYQLTFLPRSHYIREFILLR